jgi:hypothetical protein
MKNWTHTHLHTGERLRIKKDYGSIVTCYVEHPRQFNNRIRLDIIVCDKGNLIKI